MKKKHLHGKLSLKIKDLSAMNAADRQMGGVTETQGCPSDTCVLSCQIKCDTNNHSVCDLCSGADTCAPTCATCAGQGPSCDFCTPTTPPAGCQTNPGETCFTTPEAGCDTNPSICGFC